MSTHVNVITGSGSTTYQVGSGFRGPQGIQGNTGETGATGAQGDRAGLKYRFDTSTNPGAPSPGHLKFNSSTLSDVTRISIRDTDFDGTSTSALLELIDDSTSAIKARVVIRSNSNSDTSHFNFLVTSVTDEGNHHHINGTYVSGSAFDSNEIVAFDFFVTGDKGDTGSSGATALLTGYVSGAGTVAATDTVVQAVGKLNGNDELKAPIASLYPYIGGKLLTYLDEEAAIADPLISAGDIYRKTAGGVDYVNPDNVPSLDLRFADDKTLTARRGPTPVFTRGSTGTFVGSNGLIQTAAVNSPRFDHTSAGVCRGLLIEEGRTNLITQSGNASSWPNANGTVTNNGSTTAPDGSSNGFLGGIGTASLITPATSSVTGLHTASVFLKRNNTDWARVQVAQGSFAHAVNFWVNLATGAAGTLAVAVGTPTSLSAQVTPFGNSWYRVSITASYPATALLALTIISATADNSTTRVSGSVYEVWGGQLEAGSFPTSYIPTTTGTLARGADVCNITGGGFNNFYNQSEGTMLANSSSFAPQPLALPSRRVVTASDGTSGNRVAIGNIAAGFIASGLSQALIVVTGGSPQSDIGIAGLTLSSLNKTAAAYKGNDFAVSTNSSAVVTDVIGSVPTNLNRLEIGNQLNNDFLCGHIASIRYYKKRLPNAKLVTLTT